MRLRTGEAQARHPRACPVPLFAAPRRPHDAAEHAADAAHESPPLFSVDPGLMIWTIITFIIVLVILRMTAWKPLMTALEERQKSIEGAIE